MRLIDLTQTLRPGMRGVAFEPKFSFEKDGWNAQTLHLYSHCGTHMDVQAHSNAGPETIDAVPLERCMGPAWLVDLEGIAPRATIAVADLCAVADQFAPGDSLLLRTGWSRFMDQPQWRDELPRVSVELAEWCVEHKVRILGVEPPSVADVNNLSEVVRVHQTLLAGGVLIVEGLANLAELRESRFFFAALPLKPLEGDGAPVRAFAIEGMLPEKLAECGLMTRRRYLLVLAAFLLMVLLYVDRACISVAKDDVARDLGLSEMQMGWVFAAFSLGYALFQTPGGMLADRFGPRRVLAAVVVFWSLFTGLTAVAWSFGSMLAARFLFGCGEAGALPGVARAVYSWIPLKERGFVQGISFSGMRFGAAATMPLLAWMIANLGWRPSFVALMAVGIVWAAVWYVWFRDDPAQQAAVSPEELALIHSDRPQPAAEAEAPLIAASLFHSRNVWLAMAQYFCSNFTFFFCLTWLPPYFKGKYTLDPLEAGLYAALPLVAGGLGNLASGWLVDWIYRGGRLSASRRLPAMVGFMLAAVGLVASLRMRSPSAEIACLALAIFGADMTLPPSWSLCVDIGRRHSGAVSGTMNMAGNLGSFLTALAFPYLIEWTGDSATFFYAGAVLNVLAVGLWLLVRPERKLEEW